MVQFLSINFFCWISSIFFFFFKSSRFFGSPCTWIENKRSHLFKWEKYHCFFMPLFPKIWSPGTRQHCPQWFVLIVINNCSYVITDVHTVHCLIKCRQFASQALFTYFILVHSTIFKKGRTANIKNNTTKTVL